MHKKFVVVAVALLGTIGGLGTPAARAETGLAPTQPTTIGEAIVGFDRGSLPAVVRGDRLDGLDVGRVSRNGSFLTVRASSLDVVKRALGSRPGVAYVEDNTRLRALLTPNDPRFGNQYGPGLMGFPTAWGSVGYGNAGVTVAVIDSGVLATHEDLVGPRLLPGRDYVNNDATPEDDCGHGTHVAGTVGASTNNGLGVGGMSQATILPLKALALDLLDECSGSQAGIAQAIVDAADQGAKVISMSLGGSSSTTMHNAVNYAASKGAILVAAAGNDGGADSVDFPAAYPNVVAVGALTSSKARASYSDSGPQLDIAAPGSSVLSTYTGSNNAYASASGTSMATPHVAGALALALGCAPAGTTRESVINALYSTAEDLGAAGHDTSYGYGLARVDRLVATVCAPPPATNRVPTALFTAAASGARGVTVNGTSSSDRDGDPLTYTWDFGDGGTGSGATASHTYAGPGTYTITLTVDDGRGGRGSAQKQFSVASDPDTSTRTVTSGQHVWFSMSSGAQNRFVKIAVPRGATKLQATAMTSNCRTATSCPVEVDVYTRQGARPTNTAFNCRAHTVGRTETCATGSPAPAYWYVRLKWVSGSGSIRLTTTIS